MVGQADSKPGLDAEAVEAIVRSYMGRLGRRYLPVLAALAAVGLIIGLVPSVNSNSGPTPALSAGAGPNSSGGPAGSLGSSAPSASPNGSRGAITTGSSGIGTTANSSSGGGGTGDAAVSGTNGSAGPVNGPSAAAGGSTSVVSAAGPPCPSGQRQVSWTLYAPPCAGAFHGSNGGATSHGVTASTITVTYRYSNSNEAAAVNATAGNSYPSQQQFFSDLDTYINYFNTKFQLYGRKVVVKTFNGQGDWVEELQDQDTQGAQADALTAYDDGAFADISQAIDVSTIAYSQYLASYHVISIGGVVTSQSYLQQYAPYVYTALPTTTDLGYFDANLACQRLAGLKAIYAGESDFKGEIRKFGIITPSNPEYAAAGTIIYNALKSCTGQTPYEAVYTLNIPTLANQDVSIIAQMKARGITTVICGICDDVSPVFLTQAADQQDYYPEWVMIDDGDGYGQLYSQDQYAHAIGAGFTTPVPSTTEAYKVFEMADPGGTPAELSRLTIAYAVALQLFDGLQEAGPDLTPYTFERGESSLPSSLPDIAFGGPWEPASNVFAPLAGYSIAWWDPNKPSPINGANGTWQSCSGADGAWKPWNDPAAYGPAHTQINCFGT